MSSMSSEAASPVTHAQRAEDVPYPPPAVGWYATIMLAFLYWLSILDRFILSLLVDPIKSDLGISDVQFGLLHGLAFVFTFTLFGLVFGALADRTSRRRLIYLGVSIWSVATAACGVAGNFWHLLLARVGVGAGEAAMNPCATSMIADLFPRDRLTSAMAVYSIGSTIGAGTALLVGGAIVDLVADLGGIALPGIGPIRPWQAVFFIVGIPGALLAFSIFSVPEPVRRGQGQVRAGRAWYTAYLDLWAFMRAHPRFFVCHYAGFTLAAAILTGNGSWLPAHMARSYGWSTGRIGLALGLTLMGAGIAGKLTCGWAVDAMYRRGHRDAQLRWYAACLALGTPIGIVATTSASPYVFLVGLGVFMVLIAPMPACALTALNLVTPNELRGTNVATWTTVNGLIGGAAGPMVIPALSDHVYGGEPGSLGLGIATQIAICCPAAAALLFLGFRSMREAIAAAETGTAQGRAQRVV
jgi:MFS family permease